MSALSSYADISTIIAAINAMNSGAPLAMTVYTINTNTVYNPGVAEVALMLVDTNAPRTITLPNTIPLNTKIIIKDLSLKSFDNNITLSPSGGETIDGSSANVTINVNGGAFTLIMTSVGLVSLGRYVQNSPWMDNIIMFDRTQHESLIIPGDMSAMSVGPITIPSGVVVSVSVGGVWAVF